MKVEGAARKASREQAHFMHVDDLGGLEVLQATYRRQTFSRHSHEGFCVGVIDDGAQRFYRTGGEHVAPLGSIILVNADDIHTGSSATEEGWSYQAMYPTPELLAFLSRDLNIGAGATLNALESRLYNAAAANAPKAAASADGPRRLYETGIRPEWIDYNGHLTDFRYQHVFGDAVDVLFREIGVTDAYRAAGHAPYTVEAQVRYLAEVRQADSVYVTVQVLDSDAKRFWLYLRMHRASDDKLVAVGEHLYVHVDAKAAKSAPMPADMQGKLAAMRDAHATLPRPADAGRGIGFARR